MSSLFSPNQQFIEWLDNEYEKEYFRAYDNLKNISTKYTEDEFYDKIVWCATTKMYRNAIVELFHHNEKIRKSCHFDDCKYLPACLRDLK